MPLLADSPSKTCGVRLFATSDYICIPASLHVKQALTYAINVQAETG